MKKHEFLVAKAQDDLLGFIVYEIKNQNVCEILWIAIKKEERNKGLGTALMNELEYIIEEKDVRLLMVKTLADEIEYEPYRYTRLFYRNKGFFHIETIEPYPGWTVGNPCAIYVKVL